MLRRLNDDDSMLIPWNNEELKKLFVNRPKPSWAFFVYGKEDLAYATCVEGGEFLGRRFICQPEVSDAGFDKDSRRFEMVYHGGYIQQGFWEQLRREEPDRYKLLCSQKQPNDPSHPDDLFIEIGRCSSPS